MNEEDQRQLIHLTKTLLRLTDEAYRQFMHKTNEEGYEPDFYRDVKPFADKTLEVAERWKTLALTWLKEGHAKHLYPWQIENTFENLTIVSVTAFQKDTKAKRFHEMIQAINFILETMDEQLSAI